MISKTRAVILAIAIGILYYYNMSVSIPKDSNCSFVANVWTDILAFLAGGYILYSGWVVHDDVTLIVIGMAIIIEHIGQLFHNKLNLFDREKLQIGVNT